MVTTRADNRTLLKSAKFSFLSTNYLSGVTSLVLSNSDGFYPYTIGGSTTSITIAQQGATTTYRYTYNTPTGTDPEISKNIQINSQVVIAFEVGAGHFSAVNNGTFTVTGFGTNYFEVTNANGTSEGPGTIGTGSLTVGRNNSVLLGEFGSETSEIVTVSAVDKTTHTLTVGATKFAHSQDTKVYALPYNQAIFYHTTTATYNILTPITGYIDIQADSFYTVANDAVYTTGFSWYHFYNSITTKDSATSNAIPYAGFGDESVSNILASFYSLLNQNEKKLITDTDAMLWLNAGYSEMQNALNLVARDYFAEDVQTVTTASGTAETALNSNFSYVLNIYDETNEQNVAPISLSAVSSYNYDTGNTIKYYIRHDGSAFYVGFSPVPTSAIEYSIRYAFKTTKLTSYYDSVIIPGNGHYKLVDYMMWRVSPKIGRGDGINFKKAFDESIANLKIGFHKVDGSNDSWGISPESNV